MLGLGSYSDYIKSDLWQAIRARVLAQMGWKCYGCGKDASQVHHRKYGPEQLRGTDIRDMVPICSSCHQEIEFDGKTKRTLEQANAKLDIMRFAKDWHK